ncbi:MAG: DUF4388 domain-containing protein [Planctomycetes bacterium]|nr:DUF4388 domain-containing protein [Planctomycetota bacterium]
MEIRGSTGSQDLPAIFHMLAQLLAMTAKEGLLTVWDEQQRKSVYFSRRGVTLLFAQRDKFTPPAGSTLVKKGKITTDDLEKALKKQTAGGGQKRLGEILREMDLVSEDEIYDLVHEQIQEEILDMLSWEKAQFEFRESEPPEELHDQTRSYTTLTLNPTEVLLEAAKRLDEWFAGPAENGAAHPDESAEQEANQAHHAAGSESA